MTSPYLITGPALISFSGGRTSAYMLKQILDAHGGTLPDDVHVCFANTGKELEETLRFVHDCATHWGVQVRWLEFLTDLASAGPEGRFVEVGFNSASRDGEPFDRLIERKQMLPNGRQRICTEFLKVRAMFDFMESIGLGRPGQYAEVIGLRADEKRRIDSMRHDARNKARHLCFPLSSAGVVKSDIFAFWAAQEFDLALERGAGNCDQCPFIGDANRIARAQRRPATCEWWARKEIERGRRFGRHLTFVELLGVVASSPRLPMPETGDVECGLWCAGGVG